MSKTSGAPCLTSVIGHTMLVGRPKRTVIVSLAVLIFGSAVAVALFSSWGRVRILDPRFHIVGVNGFRGTNLTIYFQNQFVGRAMTGLSKLGMGVHAPVAVHGDVYASNIVMICVVYRGSIPPHELKDVSAELKDNSGRALRLRRFGPSSRDPQSGNYLGIWFHRVEITNVLGYRLRLTLPNTGAQLAEIRLKEL